MRRYIPIFLGNKGLDILFALHQHAQGNALHAAGGQALFDLGPQQGAELVAHQAIQRTTRLLRVHQPHLDGARGFDRVGNGLLGNLMELNAVRLVYVHAQRVGQMPGNRFALSVRVGCEVDFLRALGFLADLGQYLAAPMDGDVFERKIVIYIHAQLRLGKIAHMSLRGLHLIILAQEARNGARLGGRLNDYKL